jgi:hypothetical protein
VPGIILEQAGEPLEISLDVHVSAERRIPTFDRRGASFHPGHFNTSSSFSGTISPCIYTLSSESVAFKTRFLGYFPKIFGKNQTLFY